MSVREFFDFMSGLYLKRMNPTLIRTSPHRNHNKKHYSRSIDLGFPIYFPCISMGVPIISPPMEIHGISGVGPVTTILRRPPFSTAWWPVVWLEPLRQPGMIVNSWVNFITTSRRDPWESCFFLG